MHFKYLCLNTTYMYVVLDTKFMHVNTKRYIKKKTVLIQIYFYDYVGEPIISMKQELQCMMNQGIS